MRLQWRRTVLLLAGVACVVSLASTRGRPGVGYDSVFYWSAANALGDEGVLATGILHDERLARLGNPDGRPAEPGEETGALSRLHPYTAWPPGYPSALAALGFVTGLPTLTAAVVVNLLGLVLLVLAAGSLGRTLAGPQAGLLSAGAVAVWPTIQASTRMVWSDALFLGLVGLTLVALARWLHGSASGPRDGWLAAAAGLAGAATLVRYVGVTLVVLLAIAGARRALARRSGRDLLAVALALAGATGLVAPIAWRNLTVSGHLGGAERLPAEPLLDSMHAVVVSFGDLVPIVRSPWAGPADSLISAAVIVAVFGAIWVRARGIAAPIPGDREWHEGLASLLLGYAALFVVFVAALRARSVFDTDGRIFVPALLCGVVVAAGWIGRRLAEPACRTVLVALVVLGAAVTVIDGASEEWRGFHRPPDRQEPVRRWVLENLARPGRQPTLLFTDHVEMVHFFTRQPVHLLPARSSLDVLQARAPAGGLVFVVPEGSFWFRDAAGQAEYERSLADRASDRHEGEGFVVYWLPSKG